ncbi:MAG: tetratricopeptide repeat protein [Vicinamibacteria bacterium]
MSVFFLAGLLLAQLVSPQEVFQRGEELYREGRYQQAVEQYEALLAQGIEDGAIYYNLGNAYFKSGRLGPAILNYERALRAMPGDEDTEANLAFANELIVDVVQRPPMPSYVAWAVDLYHALDPDLCAALLSLSFVLGGIATSILILGIWPRFRTPAIYTLVAVGAVTFLSATVLTAKVYSSGESEAAIALAQSIEVRSGPGEANPQLAEIHEGLKVSVLGGREGWLQVRLPNGLTGWVQETDVAIV